MLNLLISNLIKNSRQYIK